MIGLIHKEIIDCWNQILIQLSNRIASNAKLASTEPATTSAGGEPNINGDNGDYCSDGLPITDVMDSSNGSVPSNTIRNEMKHKIILIIKTKLEYIAARRRLMKSMFLLLSLKVFIINSKMFAICCFDAKCL